MTGYDYKSDNACTKCGYHEVWAREIDEIHGDVRWKCFHCGATGVSEGPDY